MASIPIPRRYRVVLYIPSKNDNSMLEVCLSLPTTVSPQPTAYTGVVIAHPYGPLGGSYNNNVVGALLQWFETYSLQTLDHSSTPGDPTSRTKCQTKPVSLACVICAFNFRGCGKSKGRTSWFGEAERDDYQTIVDFLQSGSRSGSAQIDSSLGQGSENKGSTGRMKVYDETGREIEAPRIPSLSRFILSGFSYGGMIASTIPPPLKNPSNPTSARLPTSYILISYPAGVAWFLMSGSQGAFYKRARDILLGKAREEGEAESSGSSAPVKTPRGGGHAVEAYFITGAQDQFTSPKTLLSWLKTNAGINPPIQQQHANSTSWALTRPDGAIHVDIVENVDHFWIDREHELLEKIQAWWKDAHLPGPKTAGSS
ncbi:hypothetical protein BGZ68_001526 [Mortierella alpina]|nr:hypothetical protein BGZ68_001526 [Mortierella alpina]